RICRTFPVHFVGSPFGAAVECDSIGRIRVEEVQVTVGLRNFTGNLTVDRGDTRELEKAAAEDCDDPFYTLGITADHALVRRVHDQQIDPGGHPYRSSDFTGRRADNTDLPVDLLPFGDAPGSRHGPALSGKIFREKGRIVHPEEHGVSFAPGSECKESGRFTKAVADDGGRGYLEASYYVADCAAGCNLAENYGAVIVVDCPGRRSVPEHLRLE